MNQQHLLALSLGSVAVIGLSILLYRLASISSGEDYQAEREIDKDSSIRLPIPCCDKEQVSYASRSYGKADCDTVCNVTANNSTLGESPTNPATSCQDLDQMGYPSGEYWIQSPNSHKKDPTKLFCKMGKVCDGLTGGWTRIAYLDMTNHTHRCPENWKEISSPKRTCGRTEETGENGAGCSSAVFKIGALSYTRVCGRVMGYQFCNTMGFWGYYHNMEESSIDDPFVDGVTISHGDKERVHIWSFAAALHEEYKGRDAVCPCTKYHPDNEYRVIRIPPWVGKDYFCETGANRRIPPASSRNCSLLYEKVFYDDDPLWEGEGCATTSSCCKLNRPPWFLKELTIPSSNDIEVRICGSSFTRFGDTPVELVQLYIQ